MSRGGASMWTRYAILICGLAGYVAGSAPEILVGIMLVGVLLEFARRLDQGLPLMQLAAVLAVLQWLVGPAISYRIATPMERYSMYVPAGEYFGFALPATALYVFGLLTAGGSIRQRPVLRRVDDRSLLQAGLVLNGVALAAGFAADFAPAGLAFFFHLVTQLRYIGGLYFLCSSSRWKWLLIAFSYSQLFLVSQEHAVFHDLILWCGILFCHWYAQRKHAPVRKLLALVVVGIVVASIQLVKQSYREKKRLGGEPSMWGEVVEFWFGDEPAKDDPFAPASDPWQLAAARLNQGWIISAVMNNVPRYEPFAEGETVLTAITSSLLPRAVVSDKKIAGGRENFMRFTGLHLQAGTSMGISPLGEAYANFGVELGIMFMGVLGWAFSSTYFRIAQLVKKEPLFLLWLPLIFYQAIKAETELVVVMNQVVKGSIVAHAGYFTLRGMFPAIAGRRTPHAVDASPPAPSDGKPALAAGTEG